MITKEYINDRIEALRKELESKFERNNKKPDFEKGFWYKHNTEDAYGLFIELGGENKGFHNGNFDEVIYMSDVNEWKKVTDFTELEDLLKKEAVKRGLVGGAKTLTGYIIKFPLILNENKNLVDANNYIVMFKDGTWAEIVKEKTTEEWIKEYDDSDCFNFYEFMEKNNLKLIQK